jgi:flagellar protein FliS
MNPYANAVYKKQSVSTMTPIEVIVKIYDECVAQLHRATAFIGEKNFAEAHNSLSKSAELVDALRSVLDKEAGGEIATNLDALYAFFYKQITLADTKKDVALIEEILPQICELQSVFAQLSKMPREGMGGGNYG